MTNIIQFRFNAQEVRTVADDKGEPWFLANDVCAVLGYANPRQAIQKNCKERGVSKRDTPTSSGIQAMTFINEGNLYRLIVKSRKPEAEKFEQLVMEEILPTIRKTGRYESPKPATLTPAQQRHIQNRVRELAGAPGNSFAAVYRSIKDQFKVGTYKDIPADSYPALCQFLLCKPLEGELLEAEQPKALELNYPVSWIPEHNPHLRNYAYRPHGSDPSIHLGTSSLCGMDARSPSLALIGELTRAGYDVEACRLEVLAMRHQLERYSDLCRSLGTLADRHEHGGIVFKLTGQAQAIR